MEVAAAAYLGGFRGGAIAEAVAVAEGESSFNTEAGPNPVCNCRGLWQINLDAHKQYKTPDILRPAANARAAFKIYAGDWCGGKTSSGACKKFQAYKVGNWAQKLERGKRAKSNLDKRVSSLQLHDQLGRAVTGRAPMSYRTACERILTDAGVSSDGGGPEWQPGADVGNAIGDALPDFFTFPQLEGVAKALTQGSTWLRVAEVALGALLITVGIVQLTGATSLTPVGKIAKVLK